MSRSSPARFVLSVAAEVAAVVFIVSVLPRVDLRTSAGAAPSFSSEAGGANDAPSLVPPIANGPSVGQSTALSHSNWPAATERSTSGPTFETSHYQRRSPQQASPQFSREPREPPPLIAVDPARPEYVEQRLDRASQELVNTVGSYLSQAASDVLQVQPPPPAAPPRTTSPPSLSRLPPIASPPAASFSTAPAPSGSFATQPQPQSPALPRPWARY
jgi:hypothetical protein